MSQSGAQAAAFFQEVVRRQVVWWVRDDRGSPAPVASTGQRAMPYWSTAARAQRAARRWGERFRVESMSLQSWRDQELPVCCGGKGRTLFAFLCGLHDVGKATPAFQEQVPARSNA